MEQFNFTTEQIQSIFDEHCIEEDLFIYQGQLCTEDQDEEERMQNYVVQKCSFLLGDDDNRRILCLMDHASITWDEAINNINDESYKVLTDDEADEANREYCVNIIEDCYLPEIPEHAQYYIDTERWIDDIERDTCRGDNLASYDGTEHEVSCKYNYTTYCYSIFRC